MKNRIVSVIAMLLAASMCMASCANGGKEVETTEDAKTGKVTEEVTDEVTEEDTEEEEETEEEDEEEDEDGEEDDSEEEPEETPEPETEPSAPPTGGGEYEVSGGGEEIIGGQEFGGGDVIYEGGEDDIVTGDNSNTDSSVPEGYIKTESGKLLVHTISDRSTDPGEDNSTAIPYEPLKSTTVATDPKADYNKPKVRLKDIRPGLLIEGVLIGYDGYMFYKDTLADFIGDGFLAKSLYDQTVDMMKKRNDWAEKNDRKFYFVIAPNKNSVYSDYMPEGYELAEYRRYDQFVELLTEAGITAVDLRHAMREAVKENPQQNLYYKYDTHWNNHAGYIAYRVAMDLIDDDYPEVVIHDKSEYQINYEQTYMKDLAYYLGQYDALTDYGPVYTLKSGETAKLVRYDNISGWGQFLFAHQWADGYCDKLKKYTYYNAENYENGAPNIYIMRDSYSIAMVPFLKDSFAYSTYNWTFSFSENEIDKADANIIMVIVAERNLRNYANNKAVND